MRKNSHYQTQLKCVKHQSREQERILLSTIFVICDSERN